MPVRPEWVGHKTGAGMLPRPIRIAMPSLQFLRSCRSTLWMLPLLTALCVPNSAAQTGTTSSDGGEYATELAKGISAYKSADHARAIELLRPVVQSTPIASVEAVSGTAAYWLGRAHEALSQDQKARSVWKRAIQKSTEGGIDLRSADRYIRSVFENEVTDEYQQAEEIYFQLLQSNPSEGSVEEQIIQRHVAQMRFFLPPELREKVSPPVQTDPTGGARTELVSWWRSQDPELGTRVNERVVEHLRRVAWAESEYPSDEHLGFDDRGKIYVRLGPPSATRHIDVDSRQLRRVIRRIERSMGNNLRVHPSSFPENEFWIYDRWEGTYHYLFVHQGDDYRVSGAVDLIPNRLTTGMDASTGRGGAKIDVVMEAMRAALRQLSVFNANYGQEYMELADYLSRFEEARTGRRGREGDEFYNARKRSDNAALRSETGVATSTKDRPTLIAKKTVRQIRERERENERRRRENVPLHDTNALANLIELPVAHRVARFLGEDGKTNAFVFWGVEGADQLRSMRVGSKGHGESGVIECVLSEKGNGQKSGNHNARKVNIYDIYNKNEVVWPKK